MKNNINYEWKLIEVEDSLLNTLSSELNIDKFIAKLLVIRGIDTVEKGRLFFNGTVDDLKDPFTLKGVKEAVERIELAKNRGEKVLIYGDYDVDGITSIVILKNMLEQLGIETSFALPNRFKEGYGLKITKLDELKKSFKYKLLITVDFGIKATDEIKELHKKGIDIIVTDHHEPDDNIPKDVVTIINPKLPGSGYEDEPLAGVGVVFKLIQGLHKYFGVEVPLDAMLRIVSIGTVADLVPLTGENRILVKSGLDYIKSSTAIGLETMLNCCSIDKAKIQSVDISYKIAPRINALGRLGDATNAIKMFLCDSKEEAKEYADYMSRKNSERQRLEKTLEKMVLDQIATLDISNMRFLMLSGNFWHKGVIGIVASKMQKKFYRPVGIVSIEDKMAHGSIRSIEGLNIVEILDNFSNLLESYGGHHQAAGITLKAKNLPILTEKLNKYLIENCDDYLFKPKIEIDCELKFSEINDDFFNSLQSLSPFGIGNPHPIFISKDIIIETEPEIINSKHVKFYVSDGQHQFVVLGFNKAYLAKRIQKFDSADIVYTLDKVQWNKTVYFQLNLLDIKAR